ncbi:MAG: hypothetical protein JWO72_924, partial [Caulobacteraceae bacterium]|nr:hypothetical protein [Caulobacteraceae bacterium]
DELLEALNARDRVISALEQRVAALEHERAATVSPAPGPAAAPSPATAAAPPSAQTSAGDDEAQLQALSRALVQRGGLLLPAWRAEFVPSLAYANREVQGLALAQTPEGIPTVADQRLRNDQLHATAALRVGLPWASQVEVRVPYAWQHQSRSLGDGASTVNDGSGLGDVELALSHQFLREKGWRPDLLGAFSWRAPTGRDPFDAPVAAVAAGSGTHELRARITALKTTDPLVFFGALSYARDLAANKSFGLYQPGDALGVELGSILALNPETSLTLGLSQEFRGRTQIDHTARPGTDTAAASLQLGFDRVLTSRVLLDVSLGVGLTRDAPDYVLQMSLPIRFR